MNTDTVSAYTGGPWAEKPNMQINIMSCDFDIKMNQTWWHSPAQREQEDQEFKVILGYIRESEASLSYMKLSQKLQEEKKNSIVQIILILIKRACLWFSHVCPKPLKTSMLVTNIYKTYTKSSPSYEWGNRVVWLAQDSKAGKSPTDNSDLSQSSCSTPFRFP